MKIEEIPFDRIFPAKKELTPQEKANRDKFKKFLEYVRIRATDRYVFPPEILTVDEITVATRGQFQRVRRQAEIKKDIQCECDSRCIDFRERSAALSC